MYYVDEYKADRNRYETMQYNRCGKSGLKLPVVSLGLWHNFGSKDNYDMMKMLCFTAFDNGITHFDLANNYGPIYGSAEENFGRIMRDFLRPYRNELIISTKAGTASTSASRSGRWHSAKRPPSFKRRNAHWHTSSSVQVFSCRARAWAAFRL